MDRYAGADRAGARASFRAEQLSRVRTDDGADLRDRRARAQHPHRIQRSDLARPWRFLRRGGLYRRHPDAPLRGTLLGDPAAGWIDLLRTRRAVRAPGAALRGALSRAGYARDGAG